MVNTRSKFNRENRIEQPGTSRYSDDEDNMSVADHFGENIVTSTSQHQIFDEKFDQEPENVRIKMADLAGP